MRPISQILVLLVASCDEELRHFAREYERILALEDESVYPQIFDEEKKT